MRGSQHLEHTLLIAAEAIPSFTNLDKPYPSQFFSIVIWGEDRAKFGVPEETYRANRLETAHGLAILPDDLTGIIMVSGE